LTVVVVVVVVVEVEVVVVVVVAFDVGQFAPQQLEKERR
jgi:hypothetical protein